MWRAKYDMPPDDFARELDRLWDQVKPLYLSLHAYVRNRLHEKYGDAVPATGAIPADLLGNMWAQDWDNIYPLISPPNADPGYDLTALLKTAQHRLEADGQVRRGLLHLARLRAAAPKPSGNARSSSSPRIATSSATPAPGISTRSATFASRCASRSPAKISSPSITSSATTSTSCAYAHQPPSFRDSANDGFHEAVGDTIALSITPEYLVKLGLLDKAPDPSRTSACCCTRRSRKSPSCRSAW